MCEYVTLSQRVSSAALEWAWRHEKCGDHQPRDELLAKREYGAHASIEDHNVGATSRKGGKSN